MASFLARVFGSRQEDRLSGAEPTRKGLKLAGYLLLSGSDCSATNDRPVILRKSSSNLSPPTPYNALGTIEDTTRCPLYRGINRVIGPRTASATSTFTSMQNRNLVEALKKGYHRQHSMATELEPHDIVLSNDSVEGSAQISLTKAPPVAGAPKASYNDFGSHKYICTVTSIDMTSCFVQSSSSGGRLIAAPLSLLEEVEVRSGDVVRFGDVEGRIFFPVDTNQETTTRYPRLSLQEPSTFIVGPRSRRASGRRSLRGSHTFPVALQPAEPAALALQQAAARGSNSDPDTVSPSDKSQSEHWARRNSCCLSVPRTSDADALSLEDLVIGEQLPPAEIPDVAAEPPQCGPSQSRHEQANSGGSFLLAVRAACRPAGATDPQREDKDRNSRKEKKPHKSTRQQQEVRQGAGRGQEEQRESWEEADVSDNQPGIESLLEPAFDVFGRSSLYSNNGSTAASEQLQRQITPRLVGASDWGAPLAWRASVDGTAARVSAGGRSGVFSSSTVLSHNSMACSLQQALDGSTVPHASAFAELYEEGEGEDDQPSGIHTWVSHRRQAQVLDPLIALRVQSQQHLLAGGVSFVTPIPNAPTSASVDNSARARRPVQRKGSLNSGRRIPRVAPVRCASARASPGSAWGSQGPGVDPYGGGGGSGPPSTGQPTQSTPGIVTQGWGGDGAFIVSAWRSSSGHGPRWSSSSSSAQVTNQAGAAEMPLGDVVGLLAGGSSRRPPVIAQRQAPETITLQQWMGREAAAEAAAAALSSFQAHEVVRQRRRDAASSSAAAGFFAEEEEDMRVQTGQ